MVGKEEVEGGTLVISDTKSRPVYKLHVLSLQACICLAKSLGFFGPHFSYLVLAKEILYPALNLQGLLMRQREKREVAAAGA